MKRKEIMKFTQTPQDATKTCCINQNTGFYFVINTSDLPLVQGYTWCSNSGYAYNAEVGMAHRLILNAPTDMVVDHKNHNPRDNTKANLRVCTRKENSRNRLRPRHNKSGAKGVSWHRGLKKWQAVITVDGKDKFLGAFEEREDAILARDTAEREFFGEFACPNFPAELIPA